MGNLSLSDRDIQLLEKTINAREKILDTLMSKSTSLASRDIEVLTNLAESIDRSIINRFKVTIESEEVKDTKEVLRDLLLTLHKGVTINQEILQEKDTPVFKSNDSISITNGELIRKQDNINEIFIKE